MIARQLKSGATKEVQQSVAASTHELIAFCPKCKTLETLWFTGGRLAQTRKFSQESAYQRFYKYHCYIWRAFWTSVVTHAISPLSFWVFPSEWSIWGSQTLESISMKGSCDEKVTGCLVFAIP